MNDDKELVGSLAARIIDVMHRNGFDKCTRFVLSDRRFMSVPPHDDVWIRVQVSFVTNEEKEREAPPHST